MLANFLLPVLRTLVAEAGIFVVAPLLSFYLSLHHRNLINHKYESRFKDCHPFLVSVYACTRTTVEVSSRNFGEEVERQQNLIFTFDLPLVADSLTNNWDTLEYIHFTPDVKGKFKWNSPTELVFSPLTGFGAATDYTAELQKCRSETFR
ncbi:MAG: hypothetical protein U0X76_08520 [Bacteroidia bacterium]